MRRQKSVPTIQDVAQLAHVSAATVSRVLTSPERVSPATRLRVADAVRTTGYTVNVSARSLRMQRAKTILVVVPGIANSFYSAILDAVVSEAAHRSYGVLVTSRLDDDPASWLGEYLHSNRADGLLIFDGFLDTKRLHSITGDQQLPIVAAYDELPDPQVNSVLTDNLEAAQRAVAHLYELGHRRIGHISGKSRNASPNERLVGFRKAMSDFGLEIRADWIIPGSYTMKSGVEAGQAFAALPDRPTAVFAGNDEMAIGFIWSIRQHGMDCPRDVSVIAFDDIDVARNYAPALTTMRQPREQIGRIATRSLINILEGQASDTPIRVVLTSELVVRDSTAPPATLRAVG